ncbi:MAG: hypothetical protein EON54_25335 [Alcaligenaceae bacterium]|nr:MAG: hypothetical protein EON54_25335 [Alcaligenaceae bacterium]
MIASEISLSKLVIIESLDETEEKTGSALAARLRAELRARGDAFPVEVRACESASDFRHELGRLLQEAQGGHLPLVHIECHGHESDGLQFANGSEMTWAELAEFLLRINIATEWNLLVSISACFGAYFLSMVNASKPAPCWGLVAPQREVRFWDLEDGFTQFYKVLFQSHDVDTAMTAVRRSSQTADWILEFSERWFVRLLLTYLNTKCRTEDLPSRVADLRADLEAASVPWLSTREIEMQLKGQNTRALARYFDVFFSVEQLPANAQRFRPARDAAVKEINALAASGEYNVGYI